MTNFASHFQSVGLVVATIAWMIAAPTAIAQAPPAAKEHPLDPAIRQAESSLDEMKQIKDYQATMVTRTREGDKLRELEYAFIRVRHEPFSVYMYFLGPAKNRGSEMTYVEGRNDGMMSIHRIPGCGGILTIKPDSSLAMMVSRDPITDVGIKNLASAFAKRARRDKELSDACEVKFYAGVTINGRSTAMIQVTHKDQSKKEDQIKGQYFIQKARIYFDDELKVPIRYEAYGFPVKESGKPALLEEYTYLDVEVNNGFTDQDFVLRKPSPALKASSSPGRRCRPARFITNRFR